ncbi:MAG: hypothetical protein PHS71_01210 [Proteiniphilum sp.]|nr:hypothetical protein [Proteiniphilum sp.]
MKQFVYVALLAGSVWISSLSCSSSKKSRMGGMGGVRLLSPAHLAPC